MIDLIVFLLLTWLLFSKFGRACFDDLVGAAVAAGFLVVAMKVLLYAFGFGFGFGLANGMGWFLAGLMLPLAFKLLMPKKKEEL